MKVKAQLWVAGVLIGVFLGWVFFALVLPWIQRTLSEPTLGLLSVVFVSHVRTLRHGWVACVGARWRRAEDDRRC
jgi:hypothetical protein